MRRLIVWEFLSLDGVMEAPEQWVIPYQSPDVAGFIQAQNLAVDAILLGRVTYEAFAAYWPSQTHSEFGIADKLNSEPKLVVSSTLEKAGWNNSTLITKNAVKEIARLKQQPGGDIGVTGSALLVQSLMQAALVDEFQLTIYPLILEGGKRLFPEGRTMNLKLIEARSFNSGVVLLRYQPGGKETQ